MSTTIKEATARVLIDGREAESQLRELTTRSRELKKALDAANKSGGDTKKLEREYAAVKKELHAYKTEIVAVNHAMRNLNNVPLAELRKVEQVLKRQVQGMDRTSEAYQRAAERLRRVRAEITHVNSQLREMKSPSALDKLAHGFQRVQGALAPVVAFLGAFSVAKRAVSEYAKLTDVFAGVQRYTGMSADEVERLNEDLMKIDTRSSRERLNELAADAGRLGLSTHEAVLDFVEAADIIDTALGDDLGAEAVKEIGKLANLFDGGKGLKSNMLATASAINELGASSSAAEPFILNFTARLAGVGNQANMSINQIMGYASALDQDMMQVEASSTAIQKVLMDMFNAPAKYAAVAGRSVADFSRLLREDANEAFLTFLRGLGESNNLDKMAPILDALGQDGARVAAVLSDLARNHMKVVEAQRVAAEAYESGRSVIDEYNTVNNTANAQLEKSKKLFRELTLEFGRELQPVAGKLISSTGLLVKALLSIVKGLKLFGPSIATAAIAFGVLYIAQHRQRLAAQLQVFWNEKLALSFAKLKTAVRGNWFGILITAGAFLIPLLLRLTRQTEQLSAAQKALNEAESSGRKEIAEQLSRTRENLSLLHSETASLKVKQERLAELKQLIPGYTAELSAEGRVLKENRAALDAYISSQEKSIMLKHYEDKHAALLVREQELKDQRIGIKTNIELTKSGKRSAGLGSHYISSIITGSGGGTTSAEQLELSDLEAQLSKVETELRGSTEARKALIGRIEQLADVASKPLIPGGGAGGGRMPTKEKKEKDEALKKDLELEQSKWEKMRHIAQEHYQAALIGEESYHATVRLLEIAAQEGRIAVMQEHGKSVLDEQTKLNEMRLSEAKRHTKELQDAMKASLRDVSTRKREEAEEDPLLKHVSKKDELALRLSNLQESFRKGLLAEEQYYEQRKKLLDDYVQEATAKERQSAEESAAIATGLGETVNLIEQREILSVENKYAARIKAAKGNKEAEEQLNAALEAEKNAVRKKYADIGFAITAAEIVSKTALAVMDVWSKHASNPIVAGVLSGIATATGVAQLALANEQRAAVQNLWTGGFTEDGDKYEPRGVVHAGEFVANQEAVRNPTLRRLFDVIDVAQKSNTVSSLDDAALSRALRYRVSDSQLATANAVRGRSYRLERTKYQDDSNQTRVLRQLNEHLERGTLARVVISEQDGLDSQLQRYRSIKKSIQR